MCEEREQGAPVMPYFIKGKIYKNINNVKALKRGTLVIKWNGETREVDIDKDGNYLFNMADFDEWDGDNIFEPHLTLELKEETK